MVGVASSNLVVRLLVLLLVIYKKLFAGVAQLDRVPDYESGGCRFESYRLHKQNMAKVIFLFDTDILDKMREVSVRI